MSCMKKILFVLTFTLLLLNSSTLISYSDQTDDLNNQIADLQKKIDASQDQIKTLSGQIAYYDNQITLTGLKITQTEAQISAITGKIGQLEITLRSRADLLENQIVQIYKKGPVDSLQILFSDSDVSKIISRFKYMQFVQATNRKILHDTQVVQTNYAQQKTLVQDSKKKLDAQKKNLASIRAERDNLLKQTKNNEANYQKLLAQAQAELASFASFTKGYGLLPPQPQPDGWYFNQRDNRWGGSCIGNTCGRSPEYVWQVGCLLTDVAMVLKKNGQDVTPLTIARDTSYFFSNTAYMLHSALAAHGFTVNGGYNKGLIDSELSAGRLVIVHLTVNSSDGHYVVLKSGSNGEYIMNDPLTAANLSFKSSYSTSSINQVIVYR